MRGLTGKRKKGKNKQDRKEKKGELATYRPDRGHRIRVRIMRECVFVIIPALPGLGLGGVGGRDALRSEVPFLRRCGGPLVEARPIVAHV